MEILGIHSGALGDLVLFGQLLAALREARGGRVRLVAGGSKAELLAGLGAADEALDFDALPMEEAFSDRPVGGCELPRRLGPCDLLVSCFAAGDERAQRRLAALTSPAEAVFLPVRPPGGRRHLLDLWADRTGLATVPTPAWHVPGPWRRLADEALASVAVAPDAPYALIHPGSGAREKCWPLERFADLAGRLGVLPRASCLVPVFVVGPAEEEWWPAGAIDSLRRRFATVVSPPLGVLAGLSAGAGAYVGNDSGPTHLAAAVGAPTVALLGRTGREHFAPRGRRVRAPVARCLAELAVEEVLAAVRDV